MAEAVKNSIVDSIRKSLNESSQQGGATEEFILAKDSEKLVRFFTEFTDAIGIVMHDKFENLYPQPCLKYYDKPCPFCNAPGFRTTTQYAFTLWDYERQEKRLGLWKATTASPLEDILDAFDDNDTILDRDFKLKRQGQGTKGRWKAKPQAQEPFKGAVIQPFTKEKVFEILKGKIQRETVEKDEAVAAPEKKEE